MRPYFPILCPVSEWPKVHFSVEQRCLGDADGSLGSHSRCHPLGCQGVLDISFGIDPRAAGPKTPVLREDGVSQTCCMQKELNGSLPHKGAAAAVTCHDGCFQPKAGSLSAAFPMFPAPDLVGLSQEKVPQQQVLSCRKSPGRENEPLHLQAAVDVRKQMTWEEPA